MARETDCEAEPVDKEHTSPFWLQATVDDVQEVDVDQPLSESNSADYHEAATLYRGASERSSADQDHKSARIFAMLAAALDIRLTVGNPNDPYAPMAVFGDRRSAIPTDFKGSVDALSAIAGKATSAVVRSRLSDLCWHLERKRRVSALAGVTAYVELVEALASGELHIGSAKDLPANAFNSDAARLLRRCLQIARWLKGEEPILKNAQALAVRLREQAFAANDPAALRRFANIDLDFCLSDPAAVAEDVEGLIGAVAPSLDLDTEIELWRVAARAYQMAKRDDDRHRTRALAAETLVKLAEARGSAFVASKFLADAISELHGVPGKKERRKELQHRLVDVQAAIMDEMSSFSHRTDIRDLVEATVSTFEELGLVDMLFTLMGLASSPPPDKLIQEAEAQIRAYPLSSIFGTSHLDHDGKVIHRTDCASFGERGSDGAVVAQIVKAESLRRSMVVSGAIEPARQIIVSHHLISDDLIETLTRNSAFVDPRQEQTFAKGISNFFQGDRIGATYILTPLLESCLRYVLKTAGHDVTTFDAATQTQQDRMLTSLFADMRGAMEEIFGAEIVHDLEYVFLRRPGPALRHSVAHGLLTDNGPYGADAIYSCWLLFKLMMIPLYPLREDLRGALDCAS
ncbi:hypothetical protein [Bosea sp. (in: a-proteobacteria)]|uniref:DUF7380 domain-containing protein n=1 Tax=Bosea sp. (in: a-proteobacteria) TaxID=1871050 RepID=UPI0027338046|nr:hypothetical protein [Bosea sp. (in: a-proteobacteria)]MDP3409267.1 hypothetical protein [Bosea sp. (in: a-proteobacteria)]